LPARKLTTLVYKQRATLHADLADSTSIYELFGDKAAAYVIDCCLNRLARVVVK
jgi:hypothetical protein